MYTKYYEEKRANTVLGDVARVFLAWLDGNVGSEERAHRENGSESVENLRTCNEYTRM